MPEISLNKGQFMSEINQMKSSVSALKKTPAKAFTKNKSVAFSKLVDYEEDLNKYIDKYKEAASKDFNKMIKVAEKIAKDDQEMAQKFSTVNTLTEHKMV